MFCNSVQWPFLPKSLKGIERIIPVVKISVDLERVFS